MEVLIKLVESGGGDSERVIPIQRIKAPRDIRLGMDSKYTFNLVNYRSKNYFLDKKDAIDHVVELNQKMSEGSVDQTTYRMLSIHSRPECINSMSPDREMKKVIAKNGIRPVGFTLQESFGPKGLQVYSFTAKYYFPCKLK